MTISPRINVGVLPGLAVLVTGAMWGMFWMPMRALDARGLENIWVSFSLFVISLIILAPWAVARRTRFREAGGGIFITGVLTGSAFVFYATALVLTEVVNALLLFYLTPVWSTLLGYFFQGKSISRSRVVAITMGLAGLIVIIGYRDGVPLPSNPGDWLALVAGICWAWGSVRVSSGETDGCFEPAFAFLAGGALMTMFLVLLPVDLLGSFPTHQVLRDTLPWAALLSAALMVPTILILFWANLRLDAGRVGLLLMSEVVVGIVSAALLTSEPFGWREVTGAVLIVGAALIEIMQQPGPQVGSSSK